tara:strand:- start:320 stop:991 length:672 start_codon:yes stop_codon:yes gene_type:complete
MIKKHCAFVTGLLALALALAVGSPARAGKIDPDTVSIDYGLTGLRIVERQPGLSTAFSFAPFTAHKKAQVPGFSDPLGTGTDPLLKLFAGRVEHMDLLGDFHPSNPYDPTEVAPTQESVQTSYMINALLFGNQMPDHKKLVGAQLNLAYTMLSKISSKPRTTETSPLTLSGFGSVTEFTSPTQLHWTHCPDYVFRRYLHNKVKAKKHSPAARKTRPPLDCFVI